MYPNPKIFGDVITETCDDTAYNTEKTVSSMEGEMRYEIQTK